ncbi:MAG: HAD-IB family hydrolase [Acidithiobacillus sp.]|nr:HAD-IB family hydrolase [Acidithiobacillus sp.]
MTDWVAFDLDGTLTRGETIVSFYRTVLGEGRAFRLLLRSLPMLGAYALGWRSNGETKEWVLQRSLAGRYPQEFEQGTMEFIDRVLPRLLRDSVWDRLAQHRDLGQRLVLVTATLELYARPWAEQVGFDAVIATRLATDESGRFTGRLQGANCWGPEKARRLREDLGVNKLAYAYGNSRGDREMLAMAENPVCICRANRWGGDLLALSAESVASTVITPTVQQKLEKTPGNG